MTRRLIALGSLLWALITASASLAAVGPPGLTLDESAGTQAGSTVALGATVSFASSSLTGADSVANLTLAMPAGLLANAALDNGACLSGTPAATESAMPAACRVGTGTVTTTTVPIAISLYLVKPPAGGDLAGLAVYSDMLGTQLGDTGDVTVRTADAGLTIALTGIPNSFDGLPITVTRLATTLTGVRLPTRCPSPSATFGVSATGHDGSTGQASAPLTVTGCSSLTFTGSSLSATASRDTGDAGTAVTTDITQPGSGAQAASGTTVLRLPSTVFSPNVLAVLRGGILCGDPSAGHCTPVGTASTTSPLYPKPLVGRAYLTGSLTSQSLTLVFPPPFALTLTGTVTLPPAADSTITTTFSHLPDLPIGRLEVALAGGPNALFLATCAPASGPLSAALTSEDGDVTAPLSATVHVTGCPPPSPGAPAPTPGGGSKGAGGTAPSGRAPGPPTITGAALDGLRGRRSLLRLRVRAGRGAPLLSSIVVALPRGLSVPVPSRLRVTVSGGRVRSVRRLAGDLVIAFRRPRAFARIVVGGLRETPGLRTRARRRRVHRLRLLVVAVDAAHRVTWLPFAVTHIDM